MNRPALRVLEVFEPPDGGIPEHVRLVAEGLKRRGHAVTVAGRADASPRQRLEDRDIPYKPILLTGRVPDPLADLRSIGSLGSILRDNDFDVLHAHGQKAGILGRISARLRRVPSIYTPNSLVYRTQLMRPRRTSRMRFQVGLHVERALARRTAAIVAVAQDERSVAIADRLAPPTRVVVIHNGVEVDSDLAPNEELARFRGKGPLLGLVAGLRDQKGLPILLDSLELLAREGRPVRFAIVGNGPLWNEVAVRVAAAPLREHTILMPFEGRVEPYLRSLDAFVLPSLWEGLPLAILEAMAMGLPVVATAVNGTPEAVEDGVTGYLVPPKDPKALADRLMAIASDEARRCEMGEAGRRVAASRFGVDRMVDELISVYRSSAADVALRSR